MARKRDTQAETPGFAQARARLDEILAEVEDEGGDVDLLAERVREAAELIRFCRDRLAAARSQLVAVVADLAAVEQAVERDDSAPADDSVEEPVDDEGTGSPGRLPF